MIGPRLTSGLEAGATSTIGRRLISGRASGATSGLTSGRAAALLSPSADLRLSSSIGFSRERPAADSPKRNLPWSNL
jgi:hypothetical protein